MEVQQLHVKVSYTLGHSTQPVLALTRKVPVTLIDTVDPATYSTTSYGKVSLRHCLTAVCQACPELIADRARDYSVYALDPLEPAHTPLAIPTTHRASQGSSAVGVVMGGAAVGMGLMSWCLSSEPEDEEDEQFVLGPLFSHPAMGRALQVVLALQETASRTREQQQTMLKEWSTQPPMPYVPTAYGRTPVSHPASFSTSSPVVAPSRPAVNSKPRPKRTASAVKAEPAGPVPTPYPAPVPPVQNAYYYYPQAGAYAPAAGQIPPSMHNQWTMPAMDGSELVPPMPYEEAMHRLQSDPVAWQTPSVASALCFAGFANDALFRIASQGNEATPARSSKSDGMTPSSVPPVWQPAKAKGTASSQPPQPRFFVPDHVRPPKFSVPEYVRPPAFGTSSPAALPAAKQKENIIPPGRGTKRTIDQAIGPEEGKAKKRPSPPVAGGAMAKRGTFNDTSNKPKTQSRPTFIRPATPPGGRRGIPPPSSSPLFSPPKEIAVPRVRTGSHSRSSSEYNGSSTPKYGSVGAVPATSSPTRPSSPTPGARKARSTKELPPSSPLPPMSDTEEELSSATATPLSDPADETYMPTDEELASELFGDLEDAMTYY